MARWLLSGHNTRETFGVSYPLTTGFSTEVVARRQLGDFITTLAGGTEETDLTIQAMVPVQGRLYLNMSYFVRNFGLLLPFDVSSFGVPQGLLVPERKASLKVRLLLPLRLWQIYRQTAKAYREVLPRYRELLERVYWQLRASDHGHLAEADTAAADHLFAQETLEDGSAFQRAYAAVGMLNSAVSTLLSQRAPGLLSLLVGSSTSTAQLGERMWSLRQVAEHCGAETVALLREGETTLDRYRAIPEAAPLLAEVTAFLRTYGHRAFSYASEFEATRLADQPDLVLLGVGGLFAAQEPPAARAEAARQLSSHLLQQMNPARRFFWRLLLRLGHALVERREENRDTLELQNATYGLAAKLLSPRYFPGASPDHLWFYTFDELVAFAQSHAQNRVASEEIEARRAELERNRHLPDPPELIWYDPDTHQWSPVQEGNVEETITSPDEALHGIGVSAGSGPVEGIALVTNSAREAAERLLQMTGPVVLVAYVTDPVWSSLFRRLTAVVTEMGGAISHAAVVAREEGVPAVVGVQGATHRIRDGQRVRVDGATGTIEIR